MSLSRTLRALLVTPPALLWWASVAARMRLSRRRRPSRRRHVLLVSWDFPPIDSTGVHVPASFVRYAALAGWHVSVACGPAAPKSSVAGCQLAASIPAGVHVQRVSRLIAHEQHVRLHPSWTIPSIDGAYLNAVALASLALRKFTQDPPAIVLATGPRFANFLAARWLAKAFGAKLVLHYRDEWTINTPSFVEATADDRAEEARCLAAAALVGFVSDGKQTAYRAGFPDIDVRKFVTVPNGWEPYFHEQAGHGTRHLAVPPGAFTLTYTGRWHASLKPVLDAFDALLQRRGDMASRLRLVFLGNQLPDNQHPMAAFAARYPGVLMALPAASPTVAVEIQRESSALLLINDHIYDGVVPLKTFDYLCSPQPILVFGKTGGAAEIVTRLRAGIALDVADADGLAQAVATFMTQPAGLWETAERRAWCVRHSRKTLVAEMLDAMARLDAPSAA